MSICNHFIRSSLIAIFLFPGLFPSLISCSGLLQAEEFTESKNTVAEIVSSIRRDFQLPLMTMNIREEDVHRQLSLPLDNSREGKRILFSQALYQGLISFLYDDSDIESPLALVKNEWPDDPHPEKRLHEFLNQPQTQLRLLLEEERAEHGESPLENWIFFLRIPSLSDHLYWVIIDRTGNKRTYNYGFN